MPGLDLKYNTLTVLNPYLLLIIYIHFLIAFLKKNVLILGKKLLWNKGLNEKKKVWNNKSLFWKTSYYGILPGKKVELNHGINLLEERGNPLKQKMTNTKKSILLFHPIWFTGFLQRNKIALSKDSSNFRLFKYPFVDSTAIIYQL